MRVVLVVCPSGELFEENLSYKKSSREVYVLVGNSVDGELSWWGVVLVGNSPGGGRELLLSWWGIFLVGSCPGGQQSQWGVVLVGSSASGELFSWRVTPVGSCSSGE